MTPSTAWPIKPRSLGSTTDEEIAAALPELTPLSLDEFAQHLVRECPEEVSRVIDVLVAKRTRPAITREVLLISLRSIVPSIDWT